MIPNAEPFGTYHIKVGNNLYERYAWTGGDTSPDRYSAQHPDLKALRRFLFRESVSMCGGLDLWTCAGTTHLERARIFWNQARLDGWRTFSRKRGKIDGHL